MAARRALPPSGDPTPDAVRQSPRHALGPSRANTFTRRLTVGLVAGVLAVGAAVGIGQAAARSTAIPAAVPAIVATQSPPESTSPAATASTATTPADKPSPPPFRYQPPKLRAASETSTTINTGWSRPTKRGRYELQWSRDDGFGSARTVRTNRAGLVLTSMAPGTAHHLRVRLVSSARKPLSAWSRPTKIRTRSDRGLRVGSFNVKCANCGGVSWASRRGAVVSTIRAQDLDVLGVQEVSSSKLKGRGTTQFRDLISALGGPYRLTSAAVTHKQMDVRIVYNAKRIRLDSQGSTPLPSNSSSNIQRFVNWAVFTQRDTGKQFVFANTHLEPGKSLHGLRDRQIAVIASTVRARTRGKLPALVVGDFNSHKWIPGGNRARDAMLRSGYLDPLGNAYKSTTKTTGAIVEKRIRTNFSSYNDYARRAPHFRYVNGTYLDYIFVTRMRVSEWETVVRVDSKGRFIGTIPSDHNLIRATVWLPTAG